MSAGAMIFMGLSWFLVLGLVTWAFGRVLKKQAHHDPDSLGPASPPLRGSHDGIMPPPSDH